MVGTMDRKTYLRGKLRGNFKSTVEYNSEGREYIKIYWYSDDGSKEEFFSYGKWSVCCSPKGKYIIFRYPDNVYYIFPDKFKFKTNFGGKVTGGSSFYLKLSNDHERLGYLPSWSPDGDCIIFVSRSKGNKYKITSINLSL